MTRERDEKLFGIGQDGLLDEAAFRRVFVTGPGAPSTVADAVNSGVFPEFKIDTGGDDEQLRAAKAALAAFNEDAGITPKATPNATTTHARSGASAIDRGEKRTPAPAVIALGDQTRAPVPDVICLGDESKGSAGSGDEK